MSTSAIATREEEMLFICEQASVNLANAKCSCVVDVVPRVCSEGIVWTGTSHSIIL
mgnify:CR=1 FL=1